MSEEITGFEDLNLIEDACRGAAFVNNLIVPLLYIYLVMYWSTARGARKYAVDSCGQKDAMVCLIVCLQLMLSNFTSEVF